MPPYFAHYERFAAGRSGAGEQDAKAIGADHAQGMPVGEHDMQGRDSTDVTADRDAIVAHGDIHINVGVLLAASVAAEVAVRPNRRGDFLIPALSREPKILAQAPAFKR